jgi:hypothetical protein
MAFSHVKDAVASFEICGTTSRLFPEMRGERMWRLEERNNGELVGMEMDHDRA